MGWITQHMDIQKFGHISTPPHTILISEGISDISTFFKGRKISKAIFFLTSILLKFFEKIPSTAVLSEMAQIKNK